MLEIKIKYKYKCQKGYDHFLLLEGHLKNLMMHCDVTNNCNLLKSEKSSGLAVLTVDYSVEPLGAAVGWKEPIT